MTAVELRADHPLRTSLVRYYATLARAPRSRAWKASASLIGNLTEPVWIYQLKRVLGRKKKRRPK
jgi:hypothetical protein